MKLTEEDKKRYMRKLPSVLVWLLFSFTLYFSLFGTVKVISLAMTHYYGKEVYVLPYLFFRFDGVGLFMIPIVAIPSIIGWLLGTRTQFFSKPKMRVISFFNSVWANSTMLTAYGMTKMQDNVLPFFYERVDRVIETDAATNEALFSKTQSFFLLVELIPLILMLFIAMFVTTRYRRHDEDLKSAFFTYKWTGERLRKFENLEKTTDFVVEYPDVELGINKETNEMVVLPGFDRTLNTAIVGSIGTGKTAALGLPTINQDLHHFTHFINESPKLRKESNYVSEDIQGRFLNGLSVIEPSNDLCRKVYQLAKAHGIDDKAITYIDPTNPNTPGLNFLKGPVEKVSEVFAQVLAGLADNSGGGNFYFEQAQRSHLKQHIYLLKLHKDEEVTFDDLMQMYEDPLIVHEMHVKFKKRIRELFPEGKNEPNLRDNRDRYNKWLLYSGIDKWFDQVIVQKTNFQGLPEKDIHGAVQYVDLFEKDVKGLRNILTDIGRNELLARVLNGKSEFDFDKHMGGEGGILLVNTAKGQLEALGATLGKMVLMTLQNASFRREPNVSPFHHILVDEAPEYYYSAFASFPAQSRKFKVIITTLQQTLTQLRGAFGEDYMNNVVAAMRNRMVYADVSNFDGQYFSEMFGEKEVYREGESEQVVSPLQDDPVSRSGSNYQKVKEAALTSGDILFQDAFECAVKIVVNNKTMPVQQIKANFVPKEEFSEAVVKVEPEAMAEWVRLRYDETVAALDEGVLLVEDDTDLVNMYQNIKDANSLAIEADEEKQHNQYIAEGHRANEVEIPARAVSNYEQVKAPNRPPVHEQQVESNQSVEIPQKALPKHRSGSNQGVSVPGAPNKSKSAKVKEQKGESKKNQTPKANVDVVKNEAPLEQAAIKDEAMNEDIQQVSAKEKASIKKEKATVTALEEQKISSKKKVTPTASPSNQPNSKQAREIKSTEVQGEVQGTDQNESSAAKESEGLVSVKEQPEQSVVSTKSSIFQTSFVDAQIDDPHTKKFEKGINDIVNDISNQ